MSTHDSFGELERMIDYTFRDRELLRTAFSHRSILDSGEAAGRGVDNERLEFLGDAVLGFQITRLLFVAFPGKSEGDLTKFRAMLVCKATLAEKARTLDLGDLLILGPGEDKTGGREKDSLLAGAFEALIGAVFLDGGEAVASGLVAGLFESEIKAVGKGEYPFLDHKSALQEYCHQEGLGEPTYATTLVEGPPHDRTFQVAALVQGVSKAAGTGRTKKSAQQEAARAALALLTSGDPCDGL